MGLYYFDLFDGEEKRDEVGQTVANEDDALVSAILHTREIAAHQARSGCLNADSYVDVRHETGELIARITFAEALDVERSPETFLALLPLLSLAPIAVAALCVAQLGA